ncbi:tocopherol cyclase [Asimina triloba]
MDARMNWQCVRPGKSIIMLCRPKSDLSSKMKLAAFDVSGWQNVDVCTYWPVQNPDHWISAACYHFDGSPRTFFEGWYFKVSIPDQKQSFCFMYAVENPAFPNKLGTLEEAVFGPRFTGVGAQILGAEDKYICQYSEESRNFWGSRHELMLGNTFKSGKGFTPPKVEIPPKNKIGQFPVNRTENVRTVETARWEYSTRPMYGWGNVDSKQKSTAGWLAAFPIFEPHWQICMAGGLSTDSDCMLQVQCNVFKGAEGEVSLTAGGGLRKLSGLTDYFEEVAMVGVHYNGIFYEFVPWSGLVSWEITPWGYWNISAENDLYKVELETITKEPGTPLRAPTVEAGFALACKDTCYGDLRLQIWDKRYDGSKGKIVLDVTSDMAAVEVGGGPWFNTWKGASTMPEQVKRALRLPIDGDAFFDAAPIFKPPGL